MQEQLWFRQANVSNWQNLKNEITINIKSDINTSQVLCKWREAIWRNCDNAEIVLRLQFLQKGIIALLLNEHRLSRSYATTITILKLYSNSYLVLYCSTSYLQARQSLSVTVATFFTALGLIISNLLFSMEALSTTVFESSAVEIITFCRCCKTSFLDDELVVTMQACDGAM